MLDRKEVLTQVIKNREKVIENYKNYNISEEKLKVLKENLKYFINLRSTLK